MSLIRLTKYAAQQEYNTVLNSETTEYSAWSADSVDNERFYDGGEQQWTSDEVDNMAERGQYLMTMNITKKAIDAEVGIFTASKPKLICLPTRKENIGIADVASELLDQSYRDSSGLLTIKEIMFNAYRCNMAFAIVKYDASGKVVFDKLNFRDVRVHANTKKAMYEDAEWIATQRWAPVEEVKALYNIAEISTTYPYEWSSISTNYKENFKVRELFDSTGKYVLIIEKYKKLKVRDNKTGLVDTQIEKRTLIGYDYLYQETLPSSIKDYPIIPLYSSLSDNPYKFSSMHFLKDPQRFVNKMYNETIRSAQAMSSGKVIVRTTDIPNGDIEAFANNWSLPGAIVELNPGAKDPIVVHPDALNQAYFGMYQEAVSHLHRVSTLSDMANNKDSDSNKPSQDIHSKREMVMDTLKIPAGIFEAFLRQLGKCILQHVQAYMPEDNILRITGGGIALDQIEKAQKRGLDASDEKNIKSYIQEQVEKGGRILEEVELEVNDIKRAIDKVDALADLIQNYETLNMDIEVVSDSYAPSYAASKYNMVERMVEKGALPPDVLLDYSLLPDREELKLKVNSIKSLTSQIQSYSKQVEELNKQLQKKDQEYAQLQKSNIDVKNQARHDSIYKDERAKSYVNKQAMQMDRQTKLKELEIQVREFLAKLEANKEALAGTTMEAIQDVLRMNEQL